MNCRNTCDSCVEAPVPPVPSQLLSHRSASFVEFEAWWENRSVCSRISRISLWVLHWIYCHNLSHTSYPMNLSLRFILFPSLFFIVFPRKFVTGNSVCLGVCGRRSTSRSSCQLCCSCAAVAVGRWHRASPGAPELLQEALDLGADPEALAVASRCRQTTWKK